WQYKPSRGHQIMDRNGGSGTRKDQPLSQAPSGSVRGVPVATTGVGSSQALMGGQFSLCGPDQGASAMVMPIMPPLNLMDANYGPTGNSFKYSLNEKEYPMKPVDITACITFGEE
ncbi:hypothetical protein KI387_028399, partial [Taxus chinensis]